MIRIILAALRRHPSQAVAVALLAAVAAGLAAILPAYLVGAVEVGTAAAVESAPPSQRLITVTEGDAARTDVAARASGHRRRASRPLEPARAAAGDRARARPHGSRTEPDASRRPRPRLPRRRLRAPADHRHLPAGDREVMVSDRVAADLGLDVRCPARPTLPNRGRPGPPSRSPASTRRGDPDDPYWAGGTLIRSTRSSPPPATFTALARPTLIVDGRGRGHPGAVPRPRPTGRRAALVTALEPARAATTTPSTARSSNCSPTGSPTNRRVITAGVPVAGLAAAAAVLARARPRGAARGRRLAPRRRSAQAARGAAAAASSRSRSAGPRCRSWPAPWSARSWRSRCAVA